MFDIVKRHGWTRSIPPHWRKARLPRVPISAVKSIGLNELVEKATSVSGRSPKPLAFSQDVEKALEQISEAVAAEPSLDAYNPRWLAVKLFERDEDILKKVSLPEPIKNRIEEIIAAAETAMDDDAESIIINERYEAVSALLSGAYIKKSRSQLSASDKIDRVMTNRFLALPIFFLIMWGVYYVSIQTVGDWTIGWMEQLIGWVSGGAAGLLEGWGASPWVLRLLVDGILQGWAACWCFVRS